MPVEADRVATLAQVQVATALEAMVLEGTALAETARAAAEQAMVLVGSHLAAAWREPAAAMAMV